MQHVSEIHGFPENLYRTKLLQRSQDGALVIVASGFDANVDPVTFVLTSSDGGTTWTPPRIAGRGLDRVEAPRSPTAPTTPSRSSRRRAAAASAHGGSGARA